MSSRPFTLVDLPSSRQNSQSHLSAAAPPLAPTLTTDDQEYNADYVAGPMQRNIQPAALAAPQYPIFSTDEDYGIDMIGR